MATSCRLFDVLDSVSSSTTSVADPRTLAAQYISRGWQHVTDMYTAGAKTKGGVACVDAAALEFLGSVRKAMVASAFEASKQDGDGLHLQSFGSENLTSDYDVTLVGRNAPQVMWKIFMGFVECYGQTLPHAFDTNIYTTGTNTVKHAKPGAPQGLERVSYTGRDEVPMFSLRPVTTAAEAAAKTWAIAKVIQGSSTADMSLLHALFDEVDFNAAQSNLEQAHALRATITTITNEYFPDLPSDAQAVVTEYALQYHYASLLNDALYNGADDSEPCAYLQAVSSAAGSTFSSVTDVLCASMYFSVEAAWTCATINVVVLEMQGGVLSDGSGSLNEYLCAMVETYGDFVHHAEQGGGVADPSIVLKCSKYIYRMLYAAARAAQVSGDVHNQAGILREEAKRVKANVVDKRGMTTGVDLRYVYLQPGTSADTYRGVVAGRFKELYRLVSDRNQGHVNGGGAKPELQTMSSVAMLLVTALVGMLPRS